MKNNLLFILIFITPFVSKSQVNLQLNRVITHSGTLARFEEKILDTVPTGKIWKIEAKGLSGLGIVLKINGKKYINAQPFMLGFSSPNATSINEIIWLKSGDIISYSYNLDSTTGVNFEYDYFISILEFNIN